MSHPDSEKNPSAEPATASAAEPTVPFENSAPETATAGTAATAEKLAAAEAEIAKLKDLYARAIADLDNYRRRVTREKEDLRKFASQGLLEDLIPVLDNLGIGLASAENHPEAKPITDGFRMIAEQIKTTLDQHGLKEINPLGEAFDPNFHESVSQTPHPTIPDHHIATVHRIGYRLHDRLVRPATVVLSSGPSATGETGAKENSSAE